MITENQAAELMAAIEELRVSTASLSAQLDKREAEFTDLEARYRVLVEMTNRLRAKHSLPLLPLFGGGAVIH